MRTHSISTRALGLVAVGLCLALSFYGCSGGSSDSRLRVLNFNLGNVAGAFLNERLIFTFSGPVDPDSVNIQTIQIRYDASMIDIDGDCLPDNPANVNAVPEGDFIVDGDRVTFQPRIPTSPENNDVGLYPAHKIDETPDPNDCRRETDLIVTYNVTIPGFSQNNPETVVSHPNGKPVVSTFNSSFTTVVDDTFPPEIALASFVDLGPGSPEFVTLVSPLQGSTGNALDTDVSVQFTEALLPSTVTSDSIFLVGVGPTNGREERIPSTYTLDQLNGIITMTPTIQLPASVEIRAKWTEDLLDFGGNSTVVPESDFPSFSTTTAPTEGPFVTREEFDTEDNLDPNETSSLWNDAGTPGQLVAGEGGGTAMLGEFVFDPVADEVMVFDTGTYDPMNPLPSFDFANFFLGNRGTIRAVGENPLIIKSTRDIILSGIIEVRGADAIAVALGASAGTPGGAGVAGGGSGGDGGSLEGVDGGNGQGALMLGTSNRFPGGGGGSLARVCATNSETGGGGGGNYRNGALPGRGDDNNGSGGGAAGLAYGADEINPFDGTFAAGSGGGGAGGTCFDGSEYPGAGGGAGGGAVWLHAANEIDIAGSATIAGSVLTDGGAGGDNMFAFGTVGGAAGGGGSGGGILFQAIERFSNNLTTSEISAQKGGAGEAAEDGGSTDGGGGDGGFGRIRVEGRTRQVRSGAFTPSPSQGDYEVDGNSTVGTSTWFDSGVFFPNYSFTLGGRNGGGGDQDNANAYPVPGNAIKYLFQGAPPNPEDPTMPDLDNLRPDIGEFTESVDIVDDCQFIRVKVVFTYPFPHNGITPFSNFFEFSYTHEGGVITP